MLKKLFELEQQRDGIARDMRSLNDSIGENQWTNEQMTQYRSMKDSLRQLDMKIEARRDADAETKRIAQEEQEKEELEKRSRNHGADSTQEFQVAFRGFLVGGISSLSGKEQEIVQRAMSTTNGSEGQYTVPTEFWEKVTETMKSFGGVAQHCQVLNTNSGAPISWPTSNDTANTGLFVGENKQVPDANLSFGQKTLGAKLASTGVVRVPFTLIQDSGINIEAYIARQLGIRAGRHRANAIVNGNGTELQNTGLALQVTGTVNAAEKGAVSWLDLNKLKHSVDPAYRKNAMFAFNDATLQSLEEQVDGQGRPIWLPSVAGLTPATVMNTQYFIDQAVASLDSEKCAYYGDWNSFILRNVGTMGIQRLTERYADFGQIGFIGFYRFDTVLEDTSAIKALNGATDSVVPDPDDE